MPGFQIGDFPASGVKHNVEFHRQHRWRVDNPGLISQLEPKLHLYAKEVTLPQLSFEEEKILGGSLYYKVARKAIWSDVTVTYYDVFGLYKEYEKWQRLIWDPSAGIKPAVEYKGPVVLSLTNGSGDAIQTFALTGAFPKDISHSNLSYTSSDIKLLKVTFSYDFATFIDIGAIRAASFEGVRDIAAGISNFF